MSDREPVLGYYGENGESEGRVLITYTVEPFWLDPSSERFTSRQSMWQAIDIAEAFNELGYAVDVYPRDDPDITPDDLTQYDILFGFGRNFERFARRMDDTTMIYYAIGAHWPWRNPTERKCLRQLEERRGVQLPPERLLPETDSAELADTLVVLGDHYIDGDRFLARSYLDYTGEKPAYNVRLSSFDFLECATDETDFESARRNIMWFGGSGLVLKGLDRALEALAGLEEVYLYVCGPIEDNEAFLEEYHDELYEAGNVHVEGYLNVQSERFEELTRQCGYVLNPSASGVILPGALITCMHRGVIPITAIPPGIDSAPVDWGILLDDTEVSIIREAVLEASRRPPEVCREMSRNACREAKENYTKETFASDLRTALRSILDEA